MSSHFHILLRVPEPPQLTDAQRIERLEALYGPRFVPDGYSTESRFRPVAGGRV